MAQVARVGTVVRPRERLAIVADDPADDRVLEAAIEGSPEVIVSGDRHLLRLGEWGGVEIVQAAAFDDAQDQGRKSDCPRPCRSRSI